jgi:hypothetical protein
MSSWCEPSTHRLIPALPCPSRIVFSYRLERIAGMAVVPKVSAYLSDETDIGQGYAINGVSRRLRALCPTIKEMAVEHSASLILFAVGHMVPKFLAHETVEEPAGIMRRLARGSHRGGSKAKAVAVAILDESVLARLVEENQ